MLKQVQAPRLIMAEYVVCCGSPVGSDLNVQRHLDVQQVVVLAQVTGHFSLGAVQSGLQLLDGILHTHTVLL